MMRFLATCGAALLLLQLPAMGSIVTPASAELENSVGWSNSYGRSVWTEFRLGWNVNPSELRPANEMQFPPADLIAFEASSAWVNCGYLSADAVTLSDLAGVGDLHSYATLHGYIDSIIEAKENRFHENVRIAATSVCPEPATLTIWGISALALAAATYRRQKRAGKNGDHVQAAVREYLERCTSPGQHFRMLGSYLTRLADDPRWSKQDVEAFYDEVVVALHRRREHSEVA